MQIPLLPFVTGAIVLTFALAVLGWWIATRTERRRRVARRVAITQSLEQQARARRESSG